MLRLFSYAYRVTRPATLFAFGFAVLSGVLGVVLTVLVGQLVGAVPDVIAATPGAMSTTAFNLLAASLLVTFVVMSAVPTFQSAAGQVMLNHVRTDITTRIVTPLLRHPGMAHLEDSTVQDQVERVSGDNEQSTFQVTTGLQALPSLVSGRVLLIGSAGLVGHLFSWWIAVVLAAVTFLMEWYAGWLARSEIDTIYGTTDDSRKADYLLELGMRGATKELRVFGLGTWLVDRFGAAFLAIWSPLWRARRRRLWKAMPAILLHLGVHGYAIYLVGRAAQGGELPLTEVATVVPAILAVGSSYDGWSTVLVKRSEAAYDALRELPTLVASRHPEATTTTWRDSANGLPQRSIRFENVSFRYPGAEIDVLTGLTLELPAGKALALVGLNGAGKSTLVKLLAGMYEPTAGRITVDGIDLRHLADWQRQVAAIVQDFTQFPLSATDNVVLGAGERAYDVPTLHRVAAQAGIERQIERLTRGWDTILDKTYDAGADLSGGEWQRIALARALFAVATGSSVLVLDEPAAALDVRAEAELVERYLDLTAGVTSLIISHRFSVVRDAHQICVLDGGRVTEAGSHAELLALGGRYARMFRLQADRYVAGDADA